MNVNLEAEAIDFLLNRDYYINATDNEGYSVLHYAVLKYELKTVIKLLERGANVNLRTKKHNLTALHLAAEKPHNVIMVESLIKAGAIVESSDIAELTPLHISILKSSSDVVKCLIVNGSDVNFPDKNLQFTPLHLAIYEQSQDLFQLLIDNGADVNNSGKDGFTPLHLSALLGCFYFTKALINHGAKIDCRYNTNEFTPLHLAIMNSHSIGNRGGLKEANGLEYGNENSLIMKLMKYPYDTRGQDYKAVIQLLIRHRANVNALTKNGKSPLHLALENNCKDYLKLFVRHGSKLNCNGKRCLYTFLYITARNDDEDAIDELQDFQNTSLYRVIDSFKNSEIKKTIMCLCAIVDASNEIECMPVNFEIEKDYADNAKSLRINRVNVRDTEVYSKFACDRVLSDAIQEERNPQYVYDYLSMLNAVKLPLVKNYITSRTQSIADFYTHRKLKTYFESCLDEVDQLKTFMITDDQSIYDVLHMRPNRRRYYMKNLNLCEIELKFPIYYKLVLARYREDLIKKTFMYTVQLVLFKFIDIELPIICVEKIFTDLGLMNMIAMVEAAEMDV